LKTTSRLALLLLATWLAAPVGEARAVEARQVVQQATDEILAVLRNKELTDEAKRTRIEEIAYANFDFERMAKLALARSYKKLDETQRLEFQQEFRRHLALTYGRSIETYSDEDIEIGNSRTHKNGDETVAGKVVGGKNDGATLDWRMRRRDETWKVIDVVIEGVSMIANFRAQVQDIVKKKGPAALIEQLREKNNAAASAE
jgi:phospholipid transport system substrate-binding protein